jgi:hypothetical protein
LYEDSMVRAAILSLVIALLAVSSEHDGATIVNSGSTNTSGYSIKLWSDGTGSVSTGNGTPTTFTVPADTAAKFFADVKAARDSGGAQLQHCMKSASFGSRTTVQWHGWASPDFTCPPFSPAVGALSQDASAIEAAANVPARGMPGHLVRKPLPIEMRKTSTPTPEAEPT